MWKILVVPRESKKTNRPYLFAVCACCFPCGGAFLWCSLPLPFSIISADSNSFPHPRFSFSFQIHSRATRNNSLISPPSESEPALFPLLLKSSIFHRTGKSKISIPPQFRNPSDTIFQRNKQKQVLRSDPINRWRKNTGAKLHASVPTIADSSDAPRRMISAPNATAISSSRSSNLPPPNWSSTKPWLLHLLSLRRFLLRRNRSQLLHRHHRLLRRSMSHEPRRRRRRWRRIGARLAGGAWGSRGSSAGAG